MTGVTLSNITVTSIPCRGKDRWETQRLGGRPAWLQTPDLEIISPGLELGICIKPRPQQEQHWEEDRLGARGAQDSDFCSFLWEVQLLSDTEPGKIRPLIFGA